MIRALLLRGLVVGLVAGLIAGAFAFVVGEPLVDIAIGIEEGTAHAHGEGEEPPPVSRDGQRVGLFFATGLYGAAVGGLFAFAFAVFRGRTSARSDRALALWLAGVLFVAGVLVPFLKYPANPPAVGDPETITERTLLFYTMVAASLLSALAAWRLVRRLGSEWAGWARILGGAAVFTFGVAVAALLLPSVDEVPAAFPGDVLREFRLASLGLHAVLWSSLAVLFGIALQRFPIATRLR